MIIGKYKLSKHCCKEDSEIWIGIVNDGEGGVFDKSELFRKLEAIIDEFYKENF